MDGIELLVHNLSHSDLVVSLNAVHSSKLLKKENSVVARPKFSHFHGLSEQILKQVVTQGANVSITHKPLFSRKTGQPVSVDPVAVGYNFSNDPIAVKGVDYERKRKNRRNNDESLVDFDVCSHLAQGFVDSGVLCKNAVHLLLHLLERTFLVILLAHLRVLM
jgi:hypothetical protein